MRWRFVGVIAWLRGRAANASSLLLERNFFDGLEGKPEGELRAVVGAFAVTREVATQLLREDGARVEPEAVAVFLGGESEFEEALQRVRLRFPRPVSRISMITHPSARARGCCSVSTRGPSALSLSA